MKLATSDLPKLQWSILAIVLMMAVGAALIFFAFSATEVAKRDRAIAQAERNEFDGKLKQVRNEEDEIKQKSAVFKALQTRGMIGEEQRLEWVELIKDIRDTRRLIDLQYEIAPQRLLDGNPTGSYAFYSSAMKLQFRLLHEEDLTRLIGDLRSRAKALIRVRSCDVARLPASADERSGRRANLSAECEIDWLTLREVSRK